MQDEHIRRDNCQNFLPKTLHSVTNEQRRVLVPSFRGLNAWDHDPPFSDKERFAFSDLGFPKEALSEKKFEFNRAT